MDCKDLMVGDWVNYKSPSSGKLQPIKIANIYGCEFNCEVENWNIISGKSISDTDPIPLTEEILVKNGFVYQMPYDDYVINEELSLYQCGDGFAISGFCNRYLRIDYVHQLQHLLKLVGIEKEIEL